MHQNWSYNPSKYTTLDTVSIEGFFLCFCNFIAIIGGFLCISSVSSSFSNDKNKAKKAKDLQVDTFLQVSKLYSTSRNYTIYAYLGRVRILYMTPTKKPLLSTKAREVFR